MRELLLTLNVHQVNLVIIDSLSAHLRPTLDSTTRSLIAETVRAALSSVCAKGTVSVRLLVSFVPARALPADVVARRPQVILSTHLSLKLFGPDQRPSSWSRDAEALLVPQIAERWIPQDVDAWRVLLYYDERGERCVSSSPCSSSRRASVDAYSSSCRLASTLSSPTPTAATQASFAMDVRPRLPQLEPA